MEVVMEIVLSVDAATASPITMILIHENVVEGPHNEIQLSVIVDNLSLMILSGIKRILICGVWKKMERKL